MNKDSPAFPTHDADPTSDPRNRITTGGLTKREWFAGMALQGLIDHRFVRGLSVIAPGHELHPKLAAKAALAYADALLSASGEDK